MFTLTAVGAVLCVTWLLSLWPRTPRPLLQATLLVGLIADLWSVGHSLIEPRSEEQVFGQGAATALYLAGHSTSGTLSRIYSPSYSVPQHVGARLGLEQLSGIDPLQLSWTAHYVNLAAGTAQRGYGVTLPLLPHGADVSTALRDAKPDAAMLGAMNACVVAAEFPIHASDLTLEAHIDSTYIYRNERCLPRAYLVTRVQLANGWQEAQGQLQEGFDPAKGALVEGGEALSGAAGWAAAVVKEHTPNRIVVEAAPTESSLLVLAEVWSPGWWVTVDGVEHPYYRVNGVARGVYLAPGTHIVVWTYRPVSLPWGTALTACALLVFAIGGILWLKDRYAPCSVL